MMYPLSMSYSAEISRSNPTAFLFLIDQSGSMADHAGNLNVSRAQFVSDALNRVVMNLIARSSKAEGVRDYFEIGVIGYGGSIIHNPLKGALSGKVFNPISTFEKFPHTVEDRVIKIIDNEGKQVSDRIKFPVWFIPEARGNTPMRDAIRTAALEIAGWCNDHPNSYPPTVLHVTDGESSDGDPEPIAEHLKRIVTEDGEVLFFNVHTSDESKKPIKFPVSEIDIPDHFGRTLFRMSSELPDSIASAAREKGYSIANGSKGFFYNVEPIEVVDFFDIGTRASSDSLILR